MKALILNSGIGHRMGALTQDRPKALVELTPGQTLFGRQLTQLAAAGLREVVVTTGPFAEALQAHAAALGLPLHITYVHNPEYASTNYIVSMHRAAAALRGRDVLLLHGDLVLQPDVLADLLNAPCSAMAVDSNLPLPDKDFKARLHNGQIVAVGVEFFGADCVACQPAYRFTAADFARWLDAIEAFVRRGERNVYAENAFNALDGSLPLAPLELGGRLCAEIDNPQDLDSIRARLIAAQFAKGRDHA